MDEGHNDDACCHTCKAYKSDAPSTQESVAGDALLLSWEAAVVRVFSIRTGELQRFQPTHNTITFGRKAAPEVDVVIDDIVVSRRQFRLIFEDGLVFAEDTASSCGTFVDGRRIERATLCAGSTISFGDYQVIVEARG